MSATFVKEITKVAFFMSDKFQRLETEVILNSEKAKNNIAELQKLAEGWIKKRDELVRSGAGKEEVADMTKNIRQAEKEMRLLEKQSTNVVNVLNNMDSASLKELMSAEKMLNAELKKTPQNSEYFQELAQKLQEVKTHIAGIREQTKQNYAEQKQLTDEIDNMNKVMSHIDTSSLKELTMAQATLKREMAEATPNSAKYEKASINLKLVEGRIKEINAAQREVNRTIDKYDDEIKSVRKDTETVHREMRLIDNTLKNLDKSTVRDIEYSIKILNENLRDVPHGTEEFKRMTGQLKQLKTELKSINEESKENESIWTRSANFFNKNWGVITQAIASLTGLTLTVRKCVNDFAEMEEAMADTRKYTGQTTEGVRELNEEFKKIDTRTSRQELNELAGAAGRLGKTGKEDILEFVDAGNMIKVALGDDLGEGAIDQVGKLAMAFGEDDRLGLRGAMLATGSAVNELAQNSSAQAGYLVDFTARVGAFGKAIGLTQAQIMGFAAVMDESLLREEMSATAFGNMLTKMQTDTATFARIAGKSVKEFSNLLKNDANAAVLALADNIKKQDPQVMMQMFNDMGLDGSRAIAVLTTMTDKIDDVRRHQELATEAYKEGTSVISEYEVMNNTVQAQLDKAKKRFHELSVELGEKLTPVAKYAITTGSLAIKSLSVITDFMIKNWKAVAVLTSGIIAYTIAINKTVMAEKIHSAITVVRNGLHKAEAALIAAKMAAMTAWGIVVDLITGKITLATAAQQLWNKVILANPYVAAAVAAMSLVTALVNLRKSTDEATNSQQLLNDVTKEATSEIKSENSELSALIATAKNKALTDGVREQAIRKLREKYPEYLNFLSLENINSQRASIAISNLTKSLIEEAKARILLRKIQEAEEKKQDITESYFNGVSSLWKSFVAGIQAGVHNIGDKIERTINVVKNQSLDAWFGETSVTEAGLSTSGKEQFFKNYKSEINEIDQQISEMNKELRKSVEMSSKLKNNTVPEKFEPEKSDGSYSPIDKSAARAKVARERREESEKKKIEAQKKKDYKAEQKAEQGHLDALLLENYLYFTQQSHDYEEFRKNELEIRQKSIDEFIAIEKKFHGEDASEISSLLKKKEELLKDYNEQTYKLREQDLKHASRMAKMQADEDFTRKGSDIYQNEYAYQQRITQIDLMELSERLAMMREKSMEGTAEYINLQQEYEEKKKEASIVSEQYLQETLERYREEYLQLSNRRQLEITLQGLENLYKQQLISEEEYQKMKLAIQARYAQSQTESNNAGFDTNVTNAIAKAKSAAEGGYDKTQRLSMSNNPWTGQISQYSSVLAKLKEMREEDSISHLEYEQAKSDVTSDFLTNMVSAAQAAYDQINQVITAAASYYSAQSQYEQAVTSKRYDAEIEKAGNNEQKRKKLEEKKQKEIAKIKSKYNKRAMRIELAQATATMMLGAMNAYTSAFKGAPYPANLILAPAAAGIAMATGLLNLAAIKKQHAAEEAGYYEGGFTGGSNYKRRAGVVHEGEFVVNHSGVNNQNLMPILNMIDKAQKNNTIGTLTTADVSRQLGGNNTVVTPIVNVTTDNEELRQMMDNLSQSVERLNQYLDKPLPAIVAIDGPDGVAKNLDEFNKMKGNV